MSTVGLMPCGIGTSSTSSPEQSPPGTSMTDGGCAVCGDRVNGKRYGAPACLGCIVFFRRAVTNDVQYKCLKGNNCVITNESRCICRYCRLQKCFTVGMKASAIQRRDVMGPRKPKTEKKDVKQEMEDNTPNLKCLSNPSSSHSVFDVPGSPTPRTSFIETLVRLQKHQLDQHREFFAAHESVKMDGDLYDDLQKKLSGTSHRRARAQDVNSMLKVGLVDAAAWGNQFDPFRRLTTEEKKMVLTEYGFTFMLVDQGYKTTRKKESGFWMLQNDTFMHEDYFLGLPALDSKKPDAQTKAKLHPLFIHESLAGVGVPFRDLSVDEFECAILKTLLLFTQQSLFKGCVHSVQEITKRTMMEAMEYMQRIHPKTAVERLGSLLLTTSSIRCSIKALYNQTRVSDVFDLMTFDPLVRDVLLS